jgi:hypothetical protein
VRPDGVAVPYRRVLLLSGAVLMLPSSGSVAANGALTLTTALPATYPNAWMYFPAGAVFAGSAAGMYFVQMSSTTAGTIFANTYSSGAPTYALTPTPIVAAGPGSYTQTTAANIVLLSVSIPAGSMGPNGSIRVEKMGVAAGSGSKNIQTEMAGSSFASYSATTQTSFRVIDWIQNSASESANVGNSFNGIGLSASGTLLRRTVNTAVAQSLTFTFNMATATDFIGLEMATVEVTYAA